MEKNIFYNRQHVAAEDLEQIYLDVDQQDEDHVFDFHESDSQFVLANSKYEDTSLQVLSQAYPSLTLLVSGGVAYQERKRVEVEDTQEFVVSNIPTNQGAGLTISRIDLIYLTLTTERKKPYSVDFIDPNRNIYQETVYTREEVSYEINQLTGVYNAAGATKPSIPSGAIALAYIHLRDGTNKIYNYDTNSLNEGFIEDARTVVYSNRDIFQESKTYTNTASANLISYIDSQDNSTLNSANSYTNTASSNLVNYSNYNNSQTLSSANTYTDSVCSTIISYVDSENSAQLAARNTNSGYIPSDSNNDFKVTEQSTPGQGITVNATNSKFWGTNDNLFSSSSNSNVSLSFADGTYPRWDLIQLNAATGSYSVVEGTAAEIPAKPSISSGNEGLAYVYREAGSSGNTIYNKNILDIRQAITIKNTDGHFKTNFSIDQKEDTEESVYDNQQMFQTIPFETKFDNVQQDKTFLHNVDTILVPADSHEVSYTGTWINVDSSNKRFGRAKACSTVGGTAILSFTGVGANIAIETNTSGATLIVELSRDGGVTWEDKKEFSQDATGNYQNLIFNCYNGLEYGDYKIKVTTGNVIGSNPILLCYFLYTTYMIQAPVTQYSTTGTIDTVPAKTSLLTGTWDRKNYLDSNSWNATYHRTNVVGDTIEFKFYGSKCWANPLWTTASNVDVSVYIDDVQTNVKSSTFNTDIPANTMPSWIRLDDGTLEEGVHTIKLVLGTPVGADYLYICGFGYYSESSYSTLTRSLICGKDSYTVGVDDSNFTFSGAGWGGITDYNTAFLRRQNKTSTQNDYFTYTTPNDENLKAIYFITQVDNSIKNSELLVTLDGGLTRYIDTGSANYEQGSIILLLYDSRIDGDLYNKELKILNNESGEEFVVQGLIFEIGDPVEDDYINCMPKWTRFNNSGYDNTSISTSLRLDVYGAKTDQRPGRDPLIHSGWCYSSIQRWRHGIGDLEAINVCRGCYNYSNIPSNSRIRQGYYNMDPFYNGDSGQLRIHSAANWKKVYISLNRVI